MISNDYFRRASLLLQTIRNVLDLPHDPKDILSGDLLQLTLTISSSNQFSKEIWVGCHILETDGGRADPVVISANPDVLRSDPISDVVDVISHLNQSGLRLGIGLSPGGHLL